MREYKGVYKYVQYKGLMSLQKENSRDTQKGLEGWGSGQSAGDPRFSCAALISNWEDPHAPSSMTWT